MAEDRRQGKKTIPNADRERVSGTKLDAATYIGIVKDTYDPTRSGRLQVWIPDFGGTQNDKTQNDPSLWRTVSYASPYFGATFQIQQAAGGQSSNVNDFTHVNHTYGMWMTVPDIGNQVLCTFVNGDPSRGYWFACINPTLSHTMVPGIGSHPKTDPNLLSKENKAAIQPSIDTGTIKPQVLPAVEFNENDPNAINGYFYNNPKPIHEYQATILFKQGLDIDPVRGAISSTSQRETPSRVFGISTPGRPYGNDPADDPGYTKKLKEGTIKDIDYAVKSRKGGHQFVMDDGDVTGKDELIRLRTASGHQILMNDSEKVVYIANSEGSVWIELAGSGHMHIFTAGGFNVHTQGDMNFHSGKNINLHAENKINMFSTAEFNVNSNKINHTATESLLSYGGKVDIGSGGIMNIGASSITVGADGAIKINGGTVDINNEKGGHSITGRNIDHCKHNDTGFITDVNKQPRNVWREVVAVADSICTVLPQHEPWTRQGCSEDVASPVVGDPPLREVIPSICPPKNGIANYTLPPPNNKQLDNGKVKGQTFYWSTDQDFLDKVKSISGSLNLNYVDMLACMHLETGGTFDPAITNSLGFTGLIQFGGPASRACGTTQDQLREMPRVEQCDYVLKYFQVNQLNAKAPTPRLVDIYLTILWPAAVGKPDDYVVFKPNTAAQNANPLFDKEKKGYTTVSDIAAQINTNREAVLQILANAGTTADPIPDGAPNETTKNITDGSGNKATTDTPDEDPGIQEAAAQNLTGDSCPAEYVNRADNYSPTTGIGDSAPKFTPDQVKAMMSELGYFESKWDYGKVNSIYVGKYQVDALYLTAPNRRYIKPDAFDQFRMNAIFQDESYTKKDNITDVDTFREYKSQQDQIQFNEFEYNYARLRANGGIKDTDDICTAAGMLFVAHYYRFPGEEPTDTAKQWRETGGDPVAANYFNHGRYSIDVLSAGGAAPAAADAVLDGPAGENTSGIDPDDVFIFQNRGLDDTRAAFDQMSGEFKNAILRAAQDYKTKTNSKITITSAYRSPEQQQALYDKWVAAGGGPNKPTAAGITTPAKKVGSHRGVAIDSSQAAVVARTIDLAAYGLFWGGKFSTPDAVHIQLATYKPGGTIPP